MIEAVNIGFKDKACVRFVNVINKIYWERFKPVFLVVFQRLLLFIHPIEFYDIARYGH